MDSSLWTFWLTVDSKKGQQFPRVRLQLAALLADSKLKKHLDNDVRVRSPVSSIQEQSLKCYLQMQSGQK